MTTDKPTTIINRLSFALVGLVATGAFVLSYASLRQTALAYGVQHNLTWIWPLLVDFALIVFSLAVVRASLKGERELGPWLLVGLYTIGTIAFNILHAPDNLTARIVAVVAPVSLFLSFETLMAMLKAEVRRGSLVLSIGQITAKLSELEGFYQGQKDNLESELANQSRRLSEEAEAKRTELANQIGQLESQLEGLNEEVGAKANALESYNQDVEAKRRELKELTGGLTKIYLPANLSLEQKQDLANQMAGDGLTNEQVATALGVSLATVKNYKRAAKEANGNSPITDPADVPWTAGGKNGHRR